MSSCLHCLFCWECVVLSGVASLWMWGTLGSSTGGDVWQCPLHAMQTMRLRWMLHFMIDHYKISCWTISVVFISSYWCWQVCCACSQCPHRVLHIPYWSTCGSGIRYAFQDFHILQIHYFTRLSVSSEKSIVQHLAFLSCTASSRVFCTRLFTISGSKCRFEIIQNLKNKLKIWESWATSNWSKWSVGQEESRSQVPDPESQIPNPRSQIPNPKSWIPNSESWIPNSESWIPGPRF